jgi:hypothetical protein
MKAIISHDIDHITVWEHFFRDLIVPKYIARMHIELFKSKISLREYTLRWSDLFKNKWQNVDELITFNNIHHIPSSFFIAANKGIGLNYSRSAAMVWIEQMKARKCEISLHGIEFSNQQKIDEERDIFKKMTGIEHFGIRMHYLKRTEETLKMMDNAGYKFDSTEHAFRDPFRIGRMWEFPFQIMDGWMIEHFKPWQSLNIEQARDTTKKTIETAFEKNLQYLVVDFHDRYFSHSFATWLEWYMWLIEHLKSHKVTFVNYDMAIKELEASEKK